MQIDGYVQALGEDLARVAAVGDESTARAAELLAVALESALGRRLLEALGEAALELSSQLDDGRVEVRFGRPLIFDRHYDTPADRFVLRSATDEIMYEIMMLSGQEYVDDYGARIKRKMDRAEAAAEEAALAVRETADKSAG